MSTFAGRSGPTHVHETIATFQPDVVVVDSKWLIIGAPILMAFLRRSSPSAARTVVTVPELDSVAKIKAAHNGFTDIIRIDEPNELLVQTIDRVGNGWSNLDGDALWRTVRRPAPIVTDAPNIKSDIDRDIIELLRIGIPDSEIAEALNLSGQTVRNRVSAMLQRDGFANRTQLAWAYSNRTLVERFTVNPLWQD